MAADPRTTPIEGKIPDPGPIAYLTGEYPKVSHTFIQREVAALCALGLRIETCTVRHAKASDVVGPEQQAEAARTFCILDAAKNPLRLIADHLNLIRTTPRRWLAALMLAWRLRPPGPKALLWQMFYFLEAGILARHLQTRGIVHLHNHFGSSSCSVALLTATMTGLPFSFTMHGPSEFFETSHWRLDEKVARAAFTVAISHFWRSQLMYFSNRRHWNRIHIVHCGVDPERFPARPPRPDCPPHLAFVGRLDPVKGADLLLDALAALRASHPDVTATFIGDGPQAEHTRAYARTLGIDQMVNFLGAQPETAVASLLQHSDLLVLPSFAEGLPVVLMEAMATGLPVVASRIAGIPELVRDGENGILIPAGDTTALIQAMDRLLSDPALRYRLGQAGRESVLADFTIEAEARRLASLFTTSVTSS